MHAVQRTVVAVFAGLANKRLFKLLVQELWGWSTNEAADNGTQRPNKTLLSLF